MVRILKAGPASRGRGAHKCELGSLEARSACWWPEMVSHFWGYHLLWGLARSRSSLIRTGQLVSSDCLLFHQSSCWMGGSDGAWSTRAKNGVLEISQVLYINLPHARLCSPTSFQGAPILCKSHSYALRERERDKIARNLPSGRAENQT